MVSSVTVRDIAQAADVSPGTVSRVFNNRGNVTEAVRQRVLKVASDLGYFRSSSADVQMRYNQQAVQEIGFLYYSDLDNDPATVNPYWSDILRGVENESQRSRIKVIYQNIDDLSQHPQQLLATIYEMKLGGILLAGSIDVETIKTLQTTNLPIVLVDNYSAGLEVNAVLGGDYFAGSKIGVEYLIHEGHRQIAFIGGQIRQDGRTRINKSYTVELKAAGYRFALYEADIPINYELYEISNLTPQGGYEACQRLLGKKLPFSAICCVNDAIAIGVMRALHEAGLRVPDDISLLGFDDIDIAEHLIPPLTTIHVNREAMISTAIKRLQERSLDPEAANTKTTLEVELIKRRSVSASGGEKV